MIIFSRGRASFFCWPSIIWFSMITKSWFFYVVEFACIYVCMYTHPGMHAALVSMLDSTSVKMSFETTTSTSIHLFF